MEIAVGFHCLMTTTHTPTSTFHLQGSKLQLGCLPVRSLSPGGAGPKTPWSGTLQENWEKRQGVISKIHYQLSEKDNGPCLEHSTSLCFEGAWCFHVQGSTLRHWCLCRCFFRTLEYIRLHGVIFSSTVIFKYTMD
jgi:hypothetical protein